MIVQLFAQNCRGLFACECVYRLIQVLLAVCQSHLQK